MFCQISIYPGKIGRIGRTKGAHYLESIRVHPSENNDKTTINKAKGCVNFTNCTH